MPAGFLISLHHQTLVVVVAIEEVNVGAKVKGDEAKVKGDEAKVKSDEPKVKSDEPKA